MGNSRSPADPIQLVGVALIIFCVVSVAIICLNETEKRKLYLLSKRLVMKLSKRFVMKPIKESITSRPLFPLRQSFQLRMLAWECRNPPMEH